MGQSHPFEPAIRAASALDDAPVLPIADDKWLRTVPSDKCSDDAIDAVVPPVAATARTSRSRCVNGDVPEVNVSVANVGSITLSPA